ncbi:hypothetical protein [Comamonas composti]|uniref:hypothetical protein n=1 Tax=Comamonas composti TaxID=408558 RepID=UPI0004295336|nr:hypothetical protein [Comamonas composti]
MHRCTPTCSEKSGFAKPLQRRAFAALLCSAAACASLGAAAQGLPSHEARNFPPQTRFGELTISDFPTVRINGQEIRTSPGFRLFSPERTLLQAAQLPGQRMLVAYVIESHTQWLHQAWVLTPAEIEKHQVVKPTLLNRLLGS